MENRPGDMEVRGMLCIVWMEANKAAWAVVEPLGESTQSHSSHNTLKQMYQYFQNSLKKSLIKIVLHFRRY